MTNDDYGVKTQEFGSCEVRALVSLVEKSQRKTSHVKAQAGYSSLTLNAWEGHALLRARAECLGMIVWGAVADGVDFGEVVDSTESLGTN